MYYLKKNEKSTGRIEFYKGLKILFKWNIGLENILKNSLKCNNIFEYYIYDKFIQIKMRAVIRSYAELSYKFMISWSLYIIESITL